MKKASVSLLVAAVVVAAVVAAAVGTESAQAARTRQAVPRRPSAVSRLQSQLRETQAALARARANLRRARSKLAAEPTPLEAAVRQVRLEVGWSKGFAPSSYPVGALTALAAMNYVATHVSSTTYAFAIPRGLPLTKRRLKHPDSSANAILGAQAGECGYHVIAFRAIMRRLGYTVRVVSFGYHDPFTGQPGGHSSAEVRYDGGWHFFDPTYDVYWTNPTNGSVLSIAGERASAGVEHRDGILALNLFEDPLYSGNDVWFETDPAIPMSY
jgi:hypothetical protein